MWVKTLIENILFFSFKIIIWISLHLYVIFIILAIFIIYEFWWKKKQEIKKSQFIMGKTKNKQDKN